MSFVQRFFLTHISLASFLWDIGNSIAPDVTPQNAASHLGLLCLRREISSKNEIKNKKNTRLTPESESGLIQLIIMGESIRHMGLMSQPVCSVLVDFTCKST